jgi:hypothetical protein
MISAGAAMDDAESGGSIEHTRDKENRRPWPYAIIVVTALFGSL